MSSSRIRPATPEVYVAATGVFTFTMDSARVSTLDNSQLNITQLRADTRGCEGVIHLNNAGSALPPAIVVDTVVDFLRQEEMSGGYEAHAHAHDRIDRVYQSIANLLNTQPDNIALTESATSSWDRAFSAIAFTEPPVAGSRMLVSSSEYASNVLPIFQLIKRTGAVLEFIPDNSSGVVDLDAFADMLDSSVALVAINHCPSQNGLINDVTGIGTILREAGSRAWYLIDACQSIGQLPVDAPSIGADFLSATGRKFLRGPRGSGFLFCSPRAITELEPFPIDLHGGHWNSPTGYELRDGAGRFESWEKSYASILGLGAAVDYAMELGMDAIAHRISALASYTRSRLESVHGIEVLDRGTHLSGIVTFRHEVIAAPEFVSELKAHGVNVSLGTPDYSQVDYLAHGVEALVRVSPHVYNNESEIDQFVSVVSDTVARANA